MGDDMRNTYLLFVTLFILSLISCAVGKGTRPEKTPDQKLTERLIGKWEHKIHHGFYSTNEFLSDGTWIDSTTNKEKKWVKQGVWKAIAPDKIQIEFPVENKTVTKIYVFSFSDDNHVKLEDYLKPGVHEFERIH
jgi:hypothetical protein